MKKLFIVWIAFIFALSLAGSTLAQEKTKKDEQGEISKPAITKSEEAAKSEEAKEKGKEKRDISAKPYIWRVGGVVTAVDPKTKTLSVHQETVYHNRTLKLEVSGKVAKELENLKPGDLVNVWVTGNNVTALNKVS
jgi:uncharacterized membrane protein